MSRIAIATLAASLFIVVAGCSSDDASNPSGGSDAGFSPSTNCAALSKVQYKKGGKHCSIYCCFVTINSSTKHYRCPSYGAWASCTGRPSSRSCIDGCKGDAGCEMDCYQNASPGKPETGECYEDKSFTESVCDQEIARIKAGDCWDPPASQSVIDQCWASKKPDGGAEVPDAQKSGKYCELYCCFINNASYKCPSYADWAQCMGRGSARSCIEKCNKDFNCEQSCFDNVFPPGPPDPSTCFAKPGYTEAQCDAEIALIKQGQCWDPPK